jgi:hypothetical protein
MWRLLVVALVVGGLTLAGVGSVAALDYQEPIVPGEFMLVAEAPPVVPTDGGAVFFRLAIGDFDAASPAALGFADNEMSWSRAGMPGENVWIPGNQWAEETGGRAIWNWNH